jgi:hypothetical protein
VSAVRLRRRRPEVEVAHVPIPVPRATIDGWTLEGAPVAARLAKPDLRELETLLHGIDVGADTPYTYERASVLLERAGELGPALAVCEAWRALPASRWPEYAGHSKALERRRGRLHGRLAASAQAAS